MVVRSPFKWQRPEVLLVMDDASDSTLVECDDQLLVGDRMMVAPLFEGETSRTVILPRGEWDDFWTGKAIAGDRPLKSRQAMHVCLCMPVVAF
jgi:alpha-glucosidase (family GH31 glycosyl hydrolase)